MKKTQSRSTETVIKKYLFRLFDLYDLILGRATRLQSMRVAVALVVGSMVFAFCYIMFFSYLPADGQRASLVSLIMNTSEPSPPPVQRLLTIQTDNSSSPAPGIDLQEYSGLVYTFEYPSSWEVIETATPAAVLVRSAPEEMTYVRFSETDSTGFLDEYCDSPEYRCDDVSIDGVPFRSVFREQAESELRTATFSASQRGILYTIEHQYPAADEEAAAEVDAVIKSINLN